MQLRELEEFGIVTKKIYPGSIPQKIEYYLTPVGESLLPVIDAIDKWGVENKEYVVKVCETIENNK